MGIFPKNSKRAKAIIDLAHEWRSTYESADRPSDPIMLLERTLRGEFKDYEFAVEKDLRDLAGTKIEGTTTFRPHKRITIDQAIYDLARKGDGPSRFTMFHEAAHLILHQSDRRASRLTQLNRGIPYSGTSFKECPELEKEANLFAGCYMVPASAVTVDTAPVELAQRYMLSEDAAALAIKVMRAAYPAKWRLK